MTCLSCNISSTIGRPARILWAALLVIVSISSHHASAEAENCENPGPGMVKFQPQIPPRPSPVYPFFDAEDRELTIADYKGRGVVLNFWATWCGPCVREMPSLARLKAQLNNDAITVLALSEDRKGLEKVLPFFEKTGIKGLDVLIDKKGKVARKSAVRGLPVTILIDSHGMERGRVTGTAEWDSPETIEFIRRCIGPDAS